MDTGNFLIYCKMKVYEYYTEKKIETVQRFNIFQVWYGKTLQNHKCLMSTNNHDHLYFEFTYDGDKKQLYLDVYDKLENKCYEIGE